MKWLGEHMLLIGGVCMVVVGVNWFRDAVVPLAIEGEEPFGHLRGGAARLLGIGVIALGGAFILGHFLWS